MSSYNTALVYSPTQKDILKLMYSHAVRRNNDVELRAIDKVGEQGIAEETDFLEFTYSRHVNEEFSLKTAFYIASQFTNAFVFSGTDGRNETVGDYEYCGTELELKYQSKKLLVLFSHNYSQLINLRLDDRNQSQRVSAEPQGYGNDFNRISPHNSKIFLSYDINEKTALYSSMMIQWGFPGSKSFADSNNEGDQAVNAPRTDGRNDAFRGNYYLNTGASYQLSKKATIKLDLYNILGWLDEDYNKVNYVRSSEYRLNAPALALTFNYSF
ncbi:MAG: hypothetical protein HRT88_24190 [Lentisphaeraceae bacterium]|nr:hypothetical protein [Lentisphaeraceae bacterium]